MGGGVGRTIGRGYFVAVKLILRPPGALPESSKGTIEVMGPTIRGTMA